MRGKLVGRPLSRPLRERSRCKGRWRCNRARRRASIRHFPANPRARCKFRLESVLRSAGKRLAFRYARLVQWTKRHIFQENWETWENVTFLFGKKCFYWILKVLDRDLDILRFWGCIFKYFVLFSENCAKGSEKDSLWVNYFLLFVFLSPFFGKIVTKGKLGKLGKFHIFGISIL